MSTTQGIMTTEQSRQGTRVVVFLRGLLGWGNRLCIVCRGAPTCSSKRQVPTSSTCALYVDFSAGASGGTLARCNLLGSKTWLGCLSSGGLRWVGAVAGKAFAGFKSEVRGARGVTGIEIWLFAAGVCQRA